MATSDLGDLPLAVNNIVSRNFIERGLPVAPYLTGATPGVVTRGGDTNVVKWRGMDAINPDTNGGTAAPSALTELTSTAYGMGRTSTALSDTTQTATLAKYGQYVEITEEVDIFTDSAFLLQITDVLGEAAGKAVNRLQRDELETNLTVRYGSGVANTAAVAAALTKNDIKYAVNQIARANARTFVPMSDGSTNIGSTPIAQSYWMFTHHDIAEDIEGMAGFKGVETYSSHTNTVMGEFGYIRAGAAAVRCICTSEASIDVGVGAGSATTMRNDSGDTNVYSTVIIGQGCHGAAAFGTPWDDGIYRVDENLNNVDLIFKGRGSAGTADPFDEIATTAYKLWHKPKILKSDFGLVIQSAASDLS